MASTVSAEAEADPQFLYNPYPYTYNAYQPVYQPYYYPSYSYPTYTYPSYPSYPSVTTKSVPAKEEKPQIRKIVPIFDYLRSGDVTFVRPDEVRPVKDDPKQNQIFQYSIPYTQAYLNRIPAIYSVWIRQQASNA